MTFADRMCNYCSERLGTKSELKTREEILYAI